MNNILANNTNQFLQKYKNVAPNMYGDDQPEGSLRQAANKNDCIIEGQKITKSIYRSNIKYQNNIIGYLDGVRPSTSESVVYTVNKDSESVKEYLVLQDILENKELESYFRIRLMIIEGRFTSATLFLPPFVIGNGKDSIEDLIEEKNSIRKTNNYLKHNLIKVDEELEKRLAAMEMALSTVPEKDTVLILKESYAIPDGLETMNITEEVSPKIIEKGQNIVASIPGLYTAGVDLNIDDYENPDIINFESLITSPNPLLQFLPFKGESINIYEPFIKSLKIQYLNKEEKTLNSQEKDYLNELEAFRAQKQKYRENYRENIINNLPVSGKVFQAFNSITSESLSKQSKSGRDLALENLVVDTELFKPEENIPLNIKSTNVLRLIRPRKDNITIALKAMKNEIIPFPNFESVLLDKYYYQADKTKKYGASYQLYIQSLRVAGVLLSVYEQNNDIGFLYKAEELIYEWISFVSRGTKERMVWYDHPAANRAQVLIQFIYLAEKADIELDYGLFRSILKKHAEVLRSDEKYFNNNHGLMMDKSLMALGNILEDEKIFMKGYSRSVDTFWYSFSNQGTHLENSPEYHNMVLGMYEGLQKFLVSNNQTYNENILNVLELAKEYFSIILKPNRLLPPVGDSGNSRSYARKKYENFYDFESGMAVMQYDSDKPFYVNFICGYSSVTHKHKDDLSINLNYNGEDFFLDPGKFNYNNRSPVRKYVISKGAHSSFQLDKYNYSLNKTNRFERLIKLDGFSFSEGINMVRGVHAAYSETDIKLHRSVYQIKNKPIVILYDHVSNNNKEDYDFTQNFNLGANINLDEVGNEIIMNGTKESMTIKQLLNQDKPNIIDGDLNIPIAVNTVGFGVAKETKQVKYARNTSDRDVFITAIYDQKIIKDIELLSVDTSINIRINGEDYHFNI